MNFPGVFPSTCCSHPLAMVAMGHPASKGASLRGDANLWRRIQSHQLEKSRVSGQTNRLCPSPRSQDQLQATFQPQNVSPTLCYHLGEGQPHTARGKLVGSLDFFFFSLSPPFLVSHRPSRLHMGKDKAMGKRTGLSFHRTRPGKGQARCDPPLSKLKARQKPSLLFPRLPRARNLKIQSISFQWEIYTGGRGRIGYLMITLGFF